MFTVHSGKLTLQNDPIRDQVPVSISDKTSYCKISQSLESTRFVFRIVRSLWNLTGTSTAGCRYARQISKRCDTLNHQFRGFETSRDRMMRRLIVYLELYAHGVVFNFGKFSIDLAFRITQLIYLWRKGPQIWQTTFSNAFSLMKMIELLLICSQEH